MPRLNNPSQQALPAPSKHRHQKTIDQKKRAVNTRPSGREAWIVLEKRA
jgi:hypothetical protein